MKVLLLLLTALALTSCNTLIGMGRDTKQGYRWTKSKIQGTGQEETYGAPVY